MGTTNSTPEFLPGFDPEDHVYRGSHQWPDPDNSDTYEKSLEDIQGHIEDCESLAEIAHRTRETVLTCLLNVCPRLFGTWIAVPSTEGLRLWADMDALPREIEGLPVIPLDPQVEEWLYDFAFVMMLDERDGLMPCIRDVANPLMDSDWGYPNREGYCPSRDMLTDLGAEDPLDDPAED